MADWLRYWTLMQLRDRGFESRNTLGLLYLKSLGKICTPNVPRVKIL